MIPDDDDKPRQIPEKFRASIDPNDTEAYERLLANDEIQKELGEKINSPFTSNTPLEREMSKAFITLKTLEAAANFSNPATIKQYAEALATVGRYDDAAKISPDPDDKARYEKYWEAVWADDADWCEHGPKHQFLRKRIFSLRENKEVSLLACNLCGKWNAAPRPDHLREQHKTEAATRSAAPTGLSIEELRQWHHANVKTTR